MLEGHGDSRVSEYNLALGTRPSQQRQRLSSEPRRADGSDHRREQGQGSALLHGGERSLLEQNRRGALRITKIGSRLKAQGLRDGGRALAFP